MGFAGRAFCAAVASTAIFAATAPAQGTESPSARMGGINPRQAPYDAIHPLILGPEENCTLQFGRSAQVATTAAHCFDMVILGIDQYAGVRGHDGQVYRVTQVFIPHQYDPRDTGNKMYHDRAIVVVDRPVTGGGFDMEAVDPKGMADGDGTIPVAQAGYAFNRQGRLSGNPGCTIGAPRYHANGNDFIMPHDCGIAPGESGSAVWDKSTGRQRGIVTSLNYAVPITSAFIAAYDRIASGVVYPQTDLRPVVMRPDPAAIAIHRAAM